METKLSYKGEWFIPGHEDEKYHGTLKFHVVDGVELELIAPYMKIVSSSNKLDPDFILGITIEGIIITLYKCHMFSMSMSTKGNQILTFSSMFLLTGAHFYSVDELKFEIIKSSFNNLDVWLGEYGFEEINTDAENLNSFISYRLPKPIPFKINKSLCGKFNFDYSFPVFKATTKISIEQSSELILECETKMGLEEILGEMTIFQSFLTLCTYQASLITSMTLINKDLYKEFDGNRSLINIKVYYATSISAKPRKKIASEFLIKYQDIKNIFEEIIKRWYTDIDKIDPIRNLLLEHFYNPKSFTPNRFLNTIQAIETYHRRFRNNKIMSSEDHRKRKNEVLEVIPENHRNWIDALLTYSNEPTLHHRLEEIIADTTNTTISKIIVNVQDFIRDIKNSRNYYTHYDQKLEKKALKPTELFYANEKLKIILVCLVLIESGFKKEFIELILQRNERFFNHIIDLD